MHLLLKILFFRPEPESIPLFLKTRLLRNTYSDQSDVTKDFIQKAPNVHSAAGAMRAISGAVILWLV